MNFVAIPIPFRTIVTAAATAILAAALLPGARALEITPSAVVLTSSTVLKPGATSQPVSFTATNLGDMPASFAFRSTAPSERQVTALVTTSGSYEPATDRWTVELGTGESAAMQFTMR